MKRINVVAAVVAVVSLAGVQCTKSTDSTTTPSYGTGPFALTMQFTDMGPHVGQLMVINVIDAASNAVVIDTDIQMIPSAAFTLNLGKELTSGHSYNIDFFADLNTNGLYDAPPVDHAWRIALGAVTGDRTVAFAHNTNFTDIGYPQESVHSLTLALTGFGPHVGQLVEVRVVDNIYNKKVKDTTLAALPSADLHIALGTVLVDKRSYRIDWWADLNGNKTYDAPPVDHAWRIQLPGPTTDTTVTFAHAATFTDISVP